MGKRNGRTGRGWRITQRENMRERQRHGSKEISKIIRVVLKTRWLP